MVNSILDDTKKALGIMPDYTEFDSVIIMHTNSAFATLHQLGLGPNNGFMIEDASLTWDAFFSVDPTLNNIKSYVYLYVKNLFDPPTTSFQLTAYKEVLAELTWRLNVAREFMVYPTPGVEDDGIIDGGTP